MSSLINFRDLGGLANAEGQRVRPGMLFRTGSPPYATQADVCAFTALGVRLICDFRSDGERANDPADLLEASGIAYLLPNRGREVGDPLKALLMATVDRPTTEALLHDVYRAIPFDQAPSFRALFAQLVDGMFPVAWHCAWGKDRTGVFTALLLHILGIPREAIAADFERSNAAIEIITAGFMAQPRLEPVWSAPFEYWSPLMESRSEWLDTMFAQLALEQGSIDGYLEVMLGVGQREQQELRRLLLESISG